MDFSTLTLADAKVELEKLIASGEVQYNRGLFGCCVKYYVTFPNDNHKYYYNRDKSISNKLRNFIFNLLYNMPPKSSKQNTIIIDDIIAPDDDDGRPKNLTKRQRIERRKSVKTIQRAVRQRQRRKNDAVGKIIGAFNKRIKLKVDKIDTSLKDKVKAVKIIPQAIGKNQYGNIEALIENSYKVARREIPSGKKFQVYTYLKFASQKGGDDFEVRTTKFTNKSYKDMLVQVADRATELLQSDHEVLLKDFQITFNFIEIPDGGASTASRDKLSILNKTSVNRIVNDDNNCFWYALVMLIYAKHPQIKQIKMGRKIRTTLAMELCSHCELEWNKPVSFDEIPIIESKLKCNIMILDIDNIPILKTTSNIYNT